MKSPFDARAIKDPPPLPVTKNGKPTLLTAVLTVCLLLLNSCATHDLRPCALPAEVSFTNAAGRGDFLTVTLRMENGDDLPFVVDTGCVTTWVGKTLEPRLGKCLGKKKTGWAFYGKQIVSVYRAPKLYLGNTQLKTGDRVEVNADFQKHFPGHPDFVGVLGMDCLRHYCIQLDFASNKMRFLDPDQAENADLGTRFPLSCYSDSRAKLLDFGKLGFRVDSGLVGGMDIVLKARLFRQAIQKAQEPTSTNHIKMASAISPIGITSRAAKFPKIDFNGQAYTNFIVLESPSLAWPDENVIGLRFFSRHLVTLNFPKQTLYLKRETVGPIQ